MRKAAVNGPVCLCCQGHTDLVVPSEKGRKLYPGEGGLVIGWYTGQCLASDGPWQWRRLAPPLSLSEADLKTFSYITSDPKCLSSLPLFSKWAVRVFRTMALKPLCEAMCPVGCIRLRELCKNLVPTGLLNYAFSGRSRVQI